MFVTKTNFLANALPKPHPNIAATPTNSKNFTKQTLYPIQKIYNFPHLFFTLFSCNFPHYML